MLGRLNARAGLANTRARLAGPESPVFTSQEARDCMNVNGVVRIAAVSDVHYGKTSQGLLQPLFAQITESADILVLPGDLTDYGLAEEARVLAKDLTAAVKIPIVAVLGNHDYEADEADDVREVLTS